MPSPMPIAQHAMPATKAMRSDRPSRGMADHGEHDRPDRAHGAGLGRGRQPQHHRAEHEEDQDGRRHDPPQALAPQRPAAQRQILDRNARQRIGTDQGEQQRVAGEQRDLDQRRAPGPEIHVADRFPHLVGQHHQDQRRRHELRDGARSRQYAGGIAHVVLVAHHHRQRDQRHGDDLRRHRAGDRAQDEADDDDGIAEAAADRTEQLAHRVRAYPLPARISPARRP